MKPYKFRKLTEGPDIADIQAEGRHSRAGRFDEKSYTNPKAKRQARRRLKRQDKHQQDIQDQLDES